MGQYKAPTVDDSVTNRAFREQEAKSATWMIFFVYIPITLFVLAVRGVMVANGYPIIRIDVVDPLVADLYRDVMDIALIALGK